jgi:4-azaleucine resistance transporter AzlC
LNWANEALTDPPAAADGAPSQPLPERAAIRRTVLGIGLYAGAFGVTFGAVAVSAGLSILQTVLMSAVMCTGASQFAFVGVLAGAGTPPAAVLTALLLGVRNAFYGIPLSRILDLRGARRGAAAQFVIDETTAMALGQSRPPAARYAFWATAAAIYVSWTGGSLVGAELGGGIDTSRLGLDAAAPVIFLALIWPQLVRRRTLTVALGGAVAALALVRVTPAGVPIIAAAAVAVAAGALGDHPQEGRG